MAAVDPLYAQWLTGDALFVTRTDATAAARWGERARLVERVTGIATLAGAEAEADRWLAWFADGPIAEDEHQLPIGDGWAARLGRVVTLTIGKLGYDSGVDVFVVAVTDDKAKGLSTVTVLCPLKDTSGWA